jgi:dihydrofolate reductase
MGKLIYSGIMSLDGYINDASGNFDWSMPDEEVHAFVNDAERDVGTYLYGRRMYDVMSYWETADAEPGQDPVFLDYAAVWKAARKIVYSSTLIDIPTARTSVERRFDPDRVRALKENSDADISVGGASLGGQALAAGLVDECHLFLNPVVVGGGTRFLPDGLRVPLELISERRFEHGVVHLGYRVGAVPGTPG